MPVVGHKQALLSIRQPRSLPRPAWVRHHMALVRLSCGRKLKSVTAGNGVIGSYVPTNRRFSPYGSTGPCPDLHGLCILWHLYDCHQLDELKSVSETCFMKSQFSKSLGAMRPQTGTSPHTANARPCSELHVLRIIGRCTAIAWRNR